MAVILPGTIDGAADRAYSVMVTISVQNLVVHRFGTTVLDGIGLSAAPGSVTGLGSSGSGKTTLSDGGTRPGHRHMRLDLKAERTPRHRAAITIRAGGVAR